MKAADRSFRARLYDILCRQFDLEELRTLCWLVDVDYDNLRGEGKAGKARELIRYAQSRDMIPALVEEGRSLRPDVAWPDVVQPEVPAPAPAVDSPPDGADDLAGCIFISYSRTDQAYARQLAGELRGRGLTPWMDDRIDFGDRWWQTIVRAVRASAAFVVVMTPEAEGSRWVEREVLLAEREGKPIVPLLLRGREFPLLINVQYVDVTGGGMPPPVFYKRLDRALGRPAAPETTAPEAGVSGGGAPKPVTGEVKTGQGRRADRVPAIPKASPPVQEEKKLPAILTPRQPFEPEMVLIPAGEFRMGSDPKVDKGAFDDEQPQHRLFLPDYYLARTPVTNAQYLPFVQAAGQQAPQHWQGGKPPRGKEEHPVVNVSWDDALAYCRWLAQATGKPYTLPGEAEWEKGARGTDGWIYPWGNRWDAARCNSSEGGKGDTTPVGAYPRGASPYGLLDMAGNVWEWTRSLWGRGYPYNPDDGREDLEAGGARVVRGGAFGSDTRRVRCAFRNWFIPDRWLRLRGFRVVVGPGCPL